MDLPDRRVLRQQLTLPPAQLRHVVCEDDGADAIAFRSQRDGAKLDESLVCLDLDLPWGTTARHHLDRLVDRAGDGRKSGDCSAEMSPQQIPRVAEPSKGRQRIRAGVRDDARGVETEQPIANSGGRLEIHLSVPLREPALGDHPC
jgi:hypothetical protein